MDNDNRYNAARFAMLAAAGQGDDAHSLPDKVAVMFRRWALGHLREILTAYKQSLEGQDRAAIRTIRERLPQWRYDADLASVRDPQALERLPEDERIAWVALWREVAELSKRIAQ